ncbi:MAG: hypothetical protein QE271_07520 [Bacteriovoracaceae bacterium]|nr:hypothetical protein [Bacteriovoracaceae bacterium]
MESNAHSYWRKCGSCKKEIAYQTTYQVCGIASCQKFAYCSVDCWSLHNSILNHKSAWSEDRISPKKEESNFLAESAPPTGVRRVVITPPKSGQQTNPASAVTYSSDDILIVASKLKQFVKDKHDLNTSANVMKILSDHVRTFTDRAAMKAKSEGRKTLLDRDFE